MVSRLNLSSNPFRNRTLPYLLAALLLFAALISAVYGLARYRSLSTEIASGKSTITELEDKLKTLETRGEKVRQSLSNEEKELLVAGHKIVANKEFGWSRLLFDIEKVMPRDVSASRISVENVFKTEDRVSADLEFSVISSNYSSVLRMIDRMNNSGIFRASLRSQDLQETDRLKYSEYTMLLSYRPSAGFSANPGTDVALNQEEESDER